jgi:hypothetical protein
MIDTQQDKLVRHLHQLIVEARCYPKGSPERNGKLTEIIYLMQRSRRILRNSQLNQFDYEDVLSKTWLYFCRNLCEAETGRTCFNPEQANVFTWFNGYLSYRIRDRLQELAAERSDRIPPRIDPETGRAIDPTETIPDTTSTPLLIDEICQWLADRQKQLCRIHLRDRPAANAYFLILHRIVYGTPWRILAREFETTPSSLCNFYHQKCLPLLQQQVQADKG